MLKFAFVAHFKKNRAHFFIISTLVDKQENVFEKAANQSYKYIDVMLRSWYTEY